MSSTRPAKTAPSLLLALLASEAYIMFHTVRLPHHVTTPRTVFTLFQFGADFEVKDRNGCSVLRRRVKDLPDAGCFIHLLEKEHRLTFPPFTYLDALRRIDALLRIGVDVNSSTNNKSTVLMGAVNDRQVSLVRLLLEHRDRLQLEARDMHNGWTALMYAARFDVPSSSDETYGDDVDRGQYYCQLRGLPVTPGRSMGGSPRRGTPILDMLLAARAQWNYLDADGKSPLQWAKTWGHQEIIRRLEEENAAWI